MARKKFTDAYVKKLNPPKSGRFEVLDKILPGLCLRVTEKGTKSWSVLYKIDGEEVQSNRSRKLRRLTLGKYPLLGLGDARDAARDALEIADKGDDPAVLRREALAGKQEAKENTVGRLVEDYLERYAKPNLKKAKDIEQKFDKHFLPKWRDKPLDSISRKDAKELIDGIELPYAADDILGFSRAMFNWGIDNFITETNPFDRIKPPKKIRKRDRVLTDDEIKKAWNAAEKMGYPFGTIYQLLILTGQRKSDIADISWSEIDLDDEVPVLVIPRERYKEGDHMRWPHVVPLSAPVLKILEKLPRFKGGDFMFSTRAGKVPVSGFSKAEVKLYELSERTDWWPHDFRRSVETNLAKLKFPPHIYERVVGHVIRGIEGNYNHYHYLDEKRDALEAWGRYVMKLLGKGEDNVVELRGANDA